MTKRYEVQHYTECDGWTNVWLVDDEPQYFDNFDNFEGALEKLDEFLDDSIEAFERGWMDSPYDRDEFRIVEVA